MLFNFFGRKQSDAATCVPEARPAFVPPAYPVRKPRGNRRPRPPRPRPDFQPAEPTVLHDDPLKRELQCERYGFVIINRDHWQRHAEAKRLVDQAAQAIDDQFALVPEGYASVPQTVSDAPGSPEEDLETESFLLARHAVTNGQFQKFVDAEGYQNLELWPEDIWPHLIDFKDQTDHQGPRYWQNGLHDRRKADHPVVGICFYEAFAYARWAGYRLPTTAEWQMAASWRIRSSAHVLRRYPWGDALDKSRCNIWASGIGDTQPVQSYENGAAPNGVCQLIGNVWEWTATDYEVTDPDGNPVIGDMIMKDIRGGAYDTYFPAQATSFFRTGLASLIRAHNVGFRCALDLDFAAE